MSKWEQRLPIGASLKKLYSLLSPKDKRNGLILFVLMLVGAVLEVIGVAAVPAFVSAVVSPERLVEVPLVGPVLSQYAAQAGDMLIFWGALILVIVFAAKNAFLIFNFHLQLRYVMNRRMELSARLMTAYLSAPYHFHLERNTSELLRNVDSEVNTTCTTVLKTIMELVTRMVILIAVLAFLFLVEPVITLAWMVFLGIIAAIGVASISSRLQHYGLLQQQHRTKFTRALFQAFGGIKEIRVLGRERYFSRQVVGSLGTINHAIRVKSLITQAIAPVSEIVAITGLLALACGLVLIGRPTESILITLSLFVVGLVRLREASSAAMNQYANLRYSLVSIEPVFEDLKQLDGTADAPGTAPRSSVAIRDSVSLRDVSFRYKGAKEDALKGLNMTIPAGSAVGIVGSTGAGKSTVVDVLLGLLTPDQGGVYVDGRNLTEIGVQNWRATAGYVPQSIYLLDDTIRRNIALGVRDRDIDEDRLDDAVRLAQLEQFLERQPEGLATVVGESGVRISGGERQRIGIARALYNQPEVVIFDEATSALDNSTERAIMSAVDKLRGDRTIIMIAHRLSTVRSCDRLFFLKNGTVEGAGSFEELQRDHQEFRKMAADMS
ncbi:ABC transporter ATP-binding protein [Croceicoccus sp. F390]|uniref:ABC transporter ATP-binding protein n=1 Tax=Croceicoccus esteveae TaxID=3075597 RepID=A0ABU2ZFJ6_9SPHN|nr:ABC transporter ATP-binding protein [Croceicoccus sp. F390]MDT0575175.1 ABC transporter ATP-binding protein [Croceicoccus sp. F390]